MSVLRLIIGSLAILMACHVVVAADEDANTPPLYDPLANIQHEIAGWPDAVDIYAKYRHEFDDVDSLVVYQDDLETIRLAKCKISPQDFGKVLACKSLKRVIIACCDLTDAHFNAIAKAGNSIERIELYGEKISDKSLGKLVTLPYLQKIQFGYSEVNTLGFRQCSSDSAINCIAFNECLMPQSVLNDISCLPKLQEVLITRKYSDHDQLDMNCSGISKLANLETLCLWQCRIDAEDAMSFLRSKSIQYLEFCGCQFEIAAAETESEEDHKGDIVSNSSIKTLRLMGCYNLLQMKGFINHLHALTDLEINESKNDFNSIRAMSEEDKIIWASPFTLRDIGALLMEKDMSKVKLSLDGQGISKNELDAVISIYKKLQWGDARTPMDYIKGGEKDKYIKIQINN